MLDLISTELCVAESGTVRDMPVKSLLHPQLSIPDKCPGNSKNKYYNATKKPVGYPSMMKNYIKLIGPTPG